MSVGSERGSLFSYNPFLVSQSGVNAIMILSARMFNQLLD